MAGETVDIKDDGGQADVHFVYLNTNAEVDFDQAWNTPLGKAWIIAYEKLGEAQRDKDILECQENGQSLMAHLQKSLQELKEQGICPNRRFQIKCETGGAANE